MADRRPAQAFRGIDTLTALSIHLELGADWQRFERAPALGAWLGLTPSLNQSGESSRQGSITKTGSMLARRLLVESAWHYSRQPRLGATLRQPPGRPARPRPADLQPRPATPVHRVNRRMKARGKPHNVDRRRLRAPAGRASSGPPPPPTDPSADSPQVGGPGRRAISGRHARYSYEQHPPPGRHARS